MPSPVERSESTRPEHDVAVEDVAGQDPRCRRAADRGRRARSPPTARHRGAPRPARRRPTRRAPGARPPPPPASAPSTPTDRRAGGQQPVVGQEADERAVDGELRHRGGRAEAELPAHLALAAGRALVAGGEHRACRPAMRSSSSSRVELVVGAGHRVARRLQRAGAAPAPDQQDVLVAGVDEPVPVAARREDDVAGLRGLASVVRVDLAAAASTTRNSSPFGCRWRSCRAPGGSTVRPTTRSSAPALRSAMRYCTCMSIQPSSSRRPCSSGTSSMRVR